MKMVTAKKWAQSMGISEAEFNEYLEKINYQVWKDAGPSKTEMWHITEKGRQHSKKSRNPFVRAILWDFDTLVEVTRVRGKITKKYFYCDKCGAYLSTQSGFDFELQNWECKKCGHTSKLYYDPKDYE